MEHPDALYMTDVSCESISRKCH